MSIVKKVSSIKVRYVFIIVILIFLNFYQLPYYFTKPGVAKVLNEVIEVEGAYEDTGTFMLTTVRMGKANVINYVWAKLSDTRELIHEDLVRRSGESDEEYHHRQLMMMSSSQDTATIVAYRKANKEAYYENFGVLVTGIIDEMPAAAGLEIGDLIIAVDETEIKTVEELLSKLAEKKKNDSVSFQIIRDDEELTINLSIASFPEKIDKTGEKVGVGITSPITKRELRVNPNITINTDEIGGPSAGLMFSLEIYNQLVKEDISRGYQIAGTGTINEDGEVGRIGGIEQKVVAAHRAGADIFFAPNEFGSQTSNYVEAMEAMSKINTNMKLVPVDTFEEALQYLEKLETKK